MTDSLDIQINQIGDLCVIKLLVEACYLERFPDRIRLVQRSFARRFRHTEHDLVTIGASVEITTGAKISTEELAPLKKRLHKKLFRPLTISEASQRLQRSPGQFIELASKHKVLPSCRIYIKRHGKSFSYPAFAVSDINLLHSLAICEASSSPA